jgi:3-ketosteroid 9alpha-monooxygenase subunit B
MFHSLRVAAIVDETADAKSIVFDVPVALAGEFAYRAGQFLTLEVECDGERLRRCYSLASAPGCDREHKVTVKRVRDGRVSGWLHDRLSVGDRLAVKAPEGRFVLDAGDAPLLLFAGGSGITPVISILKAALSTTSRRVTLVYANRDGASVIFRGELETLQRAHAHRLRVIHRLDDVHGPLDDSAVRRVVAEARDASCFVCGPAPFMSLVEKVATSSGLPADRIKIERFSVTAPAGPAAPAGPVEGAGAPESVEIELRGERRRVACRPGQTLLQAAREAGLDAPYSCEEGFCGCCAAQLLSGRVVMDADDALSSEEKRRGVVLACQARPVTAGCSFRFVDG